MLDFADASKDFSQDCLFWDGSNKCYVKTIQYRTDGGRGSGPITRNWRPMGEYRDYHNDVLREIHQEKVIKEDEFLIAFFKTILTKGML